MLEKANYTCEKCGKNDRLEIHHTNKEKNFGLEKPNDLMVLCIYCHYDIEKDPRTKNFIKARM